MIIAFIYTFKQNVEPGKIIHNLMAVNHSIKMETPPRKVGGVRMGGILGFSKKTPGILLAV